MHRLYIATQSNQYSQPRMCYCPCMPPGSLHVLGAFFHTGVVTFKLWNGLHGIFIIQIYSDQLFSLKNYCVFNIKPYRFCVCGYQEAPKPLQKYTEAWVFVVFSSQWPWPLGERIRILCYWPKRRLAPGFGFGLDIYALVSSSSVLRLWWP